VGSPLARDADCCLVYLLMCVLIVGCRDMGLRDIRLVWLNLHLYTLRKFYFLFNTDFSLHHSVEVAALATMSAYPNTFGSIVRVRILR